MLEDDFEDSSTLDEHDPIALWMNTRVEQIHDNVSAYDVLAYHGVPLKWGGDREEQISCPFHGEDRRPSARYFPNEDGGRSGVWCFACHKRWDSIGLWIEFNGKQSFSKSLFEIEQAFNLTRPDTPKERKEKTEDPFKASSSKLLEACENRLRSVKDSFDMKSHLKLGHILDSIRFNMELGLITYEEAYLRLEKVLDKIGEKIRSNA